MKYFTKEELQCPHTKETVLAEDFDVEIDELREACGFPLIVNSCCRSAEYNDVLKGHTRSLHVYDHPHHPTGGTCAIDFSTRNLTGHQRGILIHEAWEAGFSYGLGPGFLHCDTRTATLKLEQRQFDYY